jgi:hypothetical protein
MADPTGTSNTHLGASRNPSTGLDGDEENDTSRFGVQEVVLSLQSGLPIGTLEDGGESSSAATRNRLQTGHQGRDTTETHLDGLMGGLHVIQDVAPSLGPDRMDAIGIGSCAPVEAMSTGLAEEEKEMPSPRPRPTSAEIVSGEPLHASDQIPGGSGGSSGSIKGKQKQKAVHFEWPTATQASEDAGPSARPAATMVKPGDPGWETSAGRPPAKLPIRFLDAVGRTYVFPWEKAKTWEV